MDMISGIRNRAANGDPQGAPGGDDRPWLSTSTVATFSATRAGCWKPGGIRLTPNPRRMFLVIVESAPSTTSLLGHADRPSRKWCSTHHTVSNPSESAKRISSMASS